MSIRYKFINKETVIFATMVGTPGLQGRFPHLPVQILRL